MKKETAKSTVVSIRLPSGALRRLQKLAKRFGRTASDTGAMFVEEALRRSEFSLIDFRDSPVGRQAYLQGSSLAVWEVMLVARAYGNNSEPTAKHLDWPEFKVRAAFNYAQAYPHEIEEALAENDSIDFKTLSRMLPQTTRA